MAFHFHCKLYVELFCSFSCRKANQFHSIAQIFAYTESWREPLIHFIEVVNKRLFGRVDRRRVAWFWWENEMWRMSGTIAEHQEWHWLTNRYESRSWAQELQIKCWASDQVNSDHDRCLRWESRHQLRFSVSTPVKTDWRWRSTPNHARKTEIVWKERFAYIELISKIIILRSRTSL